MEGARRQRRSRRRAGGSKQRSSTSCSNTTTYPSASANKPRAKKNAVRSGTQVAGLLVDGGVQELFVNENRIELEARELLRAISRYRKLTDQWLAATNAVNSVLKETGDFENWMKIMDFDCKSINAAIRNIHQSCFSLAPAATML